MLFTKIKQVFSNQFIRNVSWLGGGELVNRVFRLGTTVILARLLSPHDYGLAAIVLTVKEFALVFTLKSGVAAKLIQADEEDLEVLSNTAYWLNWILSIFLFVTQCLLAFPIAWFYNETQVVFPICFVALNYLLMPNYAIQMALVERENRINIVAIAATMQAIVANVGTMLMALFGLGMWAIITPGVVLSPFVWFFCAYKYHSWRPTQSFSLYRWREIVGFGTNVLGYQLLDKVRANLDYLLIGRFLGVDALGIYFFAFNAGLGISLNVMNSFVTALFPHLCAARGVYQKVKDRYFSSLKTIATVFIPLILLQSSMAPFYVPIIFGQKWVSAIPILVLICLSALPRPFASAASMLLQAVDKADINVKWSLIFTVLFAISLIVAMQWGIQAVAAAVLISHAVAMPLFTIWATRFALRPNSLWFKSEVS
jgi:O-antigen/teichoic acid export membrane protein